MLTSEQFDGDRQPSQSHQRFSIDRMLRAMEQGEQPELMTFPHQDQEFMAVVINFQPKKTEVFDEELADFVEVEQSLPVEQREYTCLIHVKNKAGVSLGKFFGAVIISGDGFVSFATHNFGYSDKSVPHIKRLMAEAIYNFIIQDVFRVWYSSLALSEGGNDTYQYLKDNKPDLTVESDNTSYDGNLRWRLVKAAPSAEQKTGN